ncbi:hypothetical protein VM1G_04375 [Cytospora mali]|uniref:Uncharacterized protein n=1 Tax=Cytospora mali TaxID=578113 RepID=A0A194VY08_CYTMA|nr:hypothetical protein VM1G_04375 [Valsa mali]
MAPLGTSPKGSLSCLFCNQQFSDHLRGIKGKPQPPVHASPSENSTGETSIGSSDAPWLAGPVIVMPSAF